MRTLDTTTSAAIKSQIRNSPIISGVTPQVLCEWNMNNVFFANGLNDFGGGNDLYSTMYSTKERLAARQPQIRANSFAKHWRETNGMRPLVAVNPTNASTWYPNYKLNEYRTYSVDDKDKTSFTNWVSPYHSTSTSSPTEVWPSGGKNLNVIPPPIIPTKRKVTIHGVMQRTSTDFCLLTRDKINKTIFKKGNFILMDRYIGLAALANVNCSEGLEILNVGQREVYEPVKFPAAAGTKILTFGSNVWGLFKEGQTLVFRSSSAVVFKTTIATVRKRKVPNTRKNDFWVEVVLADKLTTAIKRDNNIGVVFSFIMARQYNGSTTWTVTRNQGIKPNGAAVIVGSNATSAAAVNKVLSDISYTGGGGVKFISNMTITEPLIIPPNVFLDFTGITITHSITNYPYMAYFGGARTVVSGISYEPSTSATTLTLGGVPATNIQQSLIAGVKITLRVSSVNYGTVRKVITKNYTFTISSYTLGSTSITIENPGSGLPAFSGASGVLTLAPNEATVTGHNVITGGTWDAAGSTSTHRGIMSMANAHYVLIRRATWNNVSNNHAINIEGCTNIRLVGIDQSDTALNNSDPAIHQDAAGVYLTSHNYSTRADACDNIHIVGCRFNSVYGLRANVDVYSVSEKNTNINLDGNTFVGTQVGVDLCDCGDTTIQNGTITGTAGVAIQMRAHLGSVSNNLITGVTTTAGTHAVALEGENSDAAVVRTVIYNNSSLNATSTAKVRLRNTAYIIICNNAPVATTANIDGYDDYINGCANLYYNVGSLSNTWMIKNVEPTTQYISDRAEVLSVIQSNEKITLTLERPLKNVRVGDYIFLQDVSVGVDGPKKIIRLSSTNPKTPWVFDTVTLASRVSQRIAGPTGLPYQLDPDNNQGYASAVQNVVANKITAKFETSYGTPKTAAVQIKSNGTWTTVYRMLSDSDLSDEDELGDSKVDNIKTLNIYYDGSTWTTDKVYFDPTVNQNIVRLDAVRVIVDTMVGYRQYASVVELSARLVLDATEYTQSFSFDKELSDTSKFAPIGRSSSNTGSIDFLNDTGLFDQNNAGSPLYDLFKKDATVHAFVNYPGGHSIKLGTMVVDEWSNDGREKASVKLIDKSRIFQNQKCRDIFIHSGNTNAKSLTSVKDAIGAILDSIGFGNYTIYGMDDFEKMKFIWTKKEDNPWEVLQNIAEVFQISLYFDEIGRLHVMSKNYLYAPQITRTGYATINANRVIITQSLYGKGDVSEIKPGMLVKCTSATGVIADNTVVMAVGAGSNGNEVTISNNVLATANPATFVFGRQTDYDILGGSAGDRLNAPITLEAANNSYNFNVQTNVPLPATAPTSADLEQYPTCTKLVREPDFYTYSYANSGTVAWLTLIPTHNAIPAPIVGDHITVEGLGSSFDGNATLATSVTPGTYDGISYTVRYSKTATAVLTSSEEVGTAHYTSTGSAGWKAKSLSPSTQYKLSGWIFLPTGQSNVVITAGGTQTISVTNSWVPFSITFTTSSTETEKLITFTPASAALSDSIYLYQMKVTYSPSEQNNIVEGGYDEVLDASQKKLDTASKIIVKYKNLNIFGGDSTAIEGAAQDVGRNATLFEIEDGAALGVFKLKELKNGQFKYDKDNMNEKADPEFDNIQVGKGNPIPLNGKFDYKSKRYEYTGLQAFAPYATGTDKAYTIVKNEDDRNRLRELNNGLPPQWTGVGYLKKNYPEVLPTVEDPNTVPVNTIVAPQPTKNTLPGVETPMKKGGPGLPLQPGKEQWVVWNNGLKSHSGVGAIINADGFIGKNHVVALTMFAGANPSIDSYTIGMQEVEIGNKKTKLVPFARFILSSQVTVKGKKQITTKQVPLKVESFNSSPTAFMLADGLKIEVLSYIKNDRRMFDFYAGSRLVAIYSDDIRHVTQRTYSGVFFGAGTSGFVKSMYAIQHPAKLPRDKWQDPRSLVEYKIGVMRARLEAALKKDPKYVRLNAAGKKAMFDKMWNGTGTPSAAAAVREGQWQLLDYIASCRKQGSLVTLKELR